MGFLLHGSQNYIFFVFYLKGHKYRYSTKIKIKKENWDYKIQRPFARRGEVGKQNRDITNTLNEYQRAFELLKYQYKEALTKKIVKQQFDKYFHNVKEPVLKRYYSEFYKEFLQEKTEMQSLTRHSVSKYVVLNRRIEEMQETNKIKYSLTDFNNKFFVKFISYLRTDLDISDNTLSRYITAFKSFLNWCAKNDYEVNNDYKDVKIKERETSQIHLTDQDLVVLEEVKLSKFLDYYRDLFLIGVYSGQRFSDYHRFNKKYRQGDFLIIRAKKTSEFSYIPLTNKLLNLLDKYDWVFPKISGQKFNPHVQKICKIAGFDEIIQVDKFYGNKKVSKDVPKWKLIASHTARRTFITLSEQKNVPISMIMQTTGIKSLKTLRNYIKFDKDKLFEAISEAWD